MNARESYECGECGEVHDDEEDAADCCRPIIREVWRCGECKKQWAEQHEAEVCCSTEELRTPQFYQVQKKALEDAGQMKLPLRICE